MDDFAERVRASLANPNTEPWFPELTSELAAREWEKLGRELGLTPETYGTARVMAGNISAPRAIVTSLKIPEAEAEQISIESVPQEYAVRYEKDGVSFYPPEEILNTSVSACLEEALHIIFEVPSLMRSVGTLVKSLHVIRPEDADYDVSFSEPHVPFSIFVSVPESRLANDSLRVAEAIVHEAMHLQLTLIESIQPLISPGTSEYFSPWRREYRNAQGLIHGLYVFYVIDRFLGSVSVTNGWYQGSYLHGRREEIANDLAGIRSFRECAELTLPASVLVQKCLGYESIISR